MLVVPVPSSLTLETAIRFVNQLWQLPAQDEIVFDFRRLGHVEPFPMAFVSAELWRYRRAQSDTRFFARNYEAHTYAAHMGFFKSFGLDYGNEPGEASGSSTYIPLTILKTEELRRRAWSESEHVGEIIERESRRLAQLLVRAEQGDLVETLTFSFREIMRNVVEHSESEVLEYCAQYWPSESRVEIVVLDSGIGVRSSLITNPDLSAATDRDALQLALLPSISSKARLGASGGGSGDEWQNSGFGLYMTSRLCGSCGSFFIMSGDAGLLLDQGGKHSVVTTFAGTALRMVLDTSSIGVLRQRLALFRSDGFKLARSMGSKVEPSAASMMLSQDFPSRRQE